jgi:hypothetical protein|tara:strand:+ start:74 stop:295 length:222 start_codon:yes stop_codon:yes gene_type:complete
MFSYKIGKNTLNVELRSGTGVDIEFADSRPVWVYNNNSGEISALPFKGTVILLPLLTITFGYVYTVEDMDYYE